MSETIKTTLVADSRRYVSEFNMALRAAQGLKAKSEETFRALAAGGLGAIGAAVSVGALVGKWNSLREEFDRVGKLSTRLDLPVEDVQILSQVAADAGYDIEKLANVLQKAQLSALKARDGNDEAAAAFGKLGINADQFARLDATERLQALSKAFNAAADEGAAVAAMAQIVGGKLALDLIPTLKGGEEGIVKMRNELHLLSDADVRIFEQMNDDIELLSKNLDVELARSFASLAPIIIDVVKALADASEGAKNFLDGTEGFGRGRNNSGAAILGKMRGLVDDRNERKQSLSALQGLGAAAASSPIAGYLKWLQMRDTGALNTLQQAFSQLSAQEQEKARFLDKISQLEKQNLPPAQFRERVNALKAERDAALAAADAEDERQNKIRAAAEAEKEAAEALQAANEVRAKAADILAKGELAGLDPAEAVRRRKEQISQEVNMPGATSGGVRAALETAATPEAAERLLKLYQELLSLEDQERDLAKTAAKEEEDRAKQLAEQAARRQEMIDQVDALRLEAQGNTGAAEALREEIELRRQAKDLAQQAGMSEADALAIAREKLLLEKQVAEAKKEQDKQKAMADIGGEIAALRLELEGKKNLAEALRTEMRLREEAKNLAAQTGMNEEQALNALREKERLQKAVNAMEKDKNKGGRPRGLLDVDESTARRELRRSSRDTLGTDLALNKKRPSGLRPAEERRRAEERQRMPRTGPDKTLEFWSKQIDLQEQLVRSFQRLGVV